MFKSAAKKFLLWCWYYLFEYFKTFLFPQIKEAFIEAKDKFLESLWDRIKDDLHEHIENGTNYIKEYVLSTDYEAREKVVLENIFKKVNLPLPLKPFKPLIKNAIKKKIRALISDSLKKLDIII